MAVQTLLLSPTAAIQNIVMLTELVVVAFVASFFVPMAQLQCHILTLEFAVDVFAAALTHVTSPSPPIKMSGPPSPPSRRHRWLIVALYFWSDAWTIG